MSMHEIKTWAADLAIAGWRRDGGWWVHPEVPGLHNMAAAIRIFKSWVC